MKKLRLVLYVFIFGLLVAFVVPVFMGNSELFKVTSNQLSNTALVQDSLVELSEWTTLKYTYKNVIVSRTEKIISLIITDIKYGETIQLIEYTGYLKAGTDLSKSQITYDETSKKLVVRVQKSRIFDNVIETENTKVEDVKGNIFANYSTQLVFDIINAEKKILEEEKIRQGFLEEADARVRTLLTAFLKARGYEDITIIFY